MTGLIKFGQTDARNILERASARETAVRVAAGSVAKQYLSALGVQVGGYVKGVCGIEDDCEYKFSDLAAAKSSPLFMLSKEKEEAAMRLIDELREKGDTAGGVVEIRVHGLKRGFGGCMN